MADKLLAEWFWTDRWIGSSAFGLPIDARGLYREMLTQAWRRGARLPNDHEQIRRMTGVTLKEWRRCWTLVERFWRVDGDSLVNDTQLEVYADASARSQKASERGQKGAAARAQALLKQSTSTAQAPLEHQPPSPSPSPSPIVPVLKNKQEQEAPGARSKRPIFTGQRLTVFEWMFDDCRRTLGEYTNDFGLDEWFFDLDADLVRKGLIIQKKDGGEWLQAQLVAEAQRRGLPLRFASGKPAMGKLATNLASAVVNIRREAGR